MAYADYRLCDVCGGKAFYDSNLSYEFDGDETEYTVGPLVAQNGEPQSYRLAYLASWAVVCMDCSKEWTARVVKREPAGERESGGGA
jgi:hypothetical protein